MEHVFPFGANWTKFLEAVDDRRVEIAVTSIQQMTRLQRLDGIRFLDIGSGSGLFSLAARRLGADVVSFDADLESVACTREMKRRYADGDGCWTITQGSVLNAAFMESLGEFDIVYSWGVLHHTGALWNAMEAAISRLKPTGRLCISIYNDQGKRSVIWWHVKRLYQRVPHPLRPLYTLAAIAPIELRRFAMSPKGYLANVRGYSKNRGMSYWRDWVDWVGGFPYEPATPKLIVEFCTHRNFLLYAINVSRGHGCNEFGFIRR